ncbi:MAG TPA: helix-turn-helix domain-containing protein [Acidothermaceae bacterium]
MPEYPHLISSAQVAAKLGKDIRSVHRMVARGEIPTAGKMPGVRGAYLFDAEAIDRMLEPTQATA